MSSFVHIMRTFAITDFQHFAPILPPTIIAVYGIIAIYVYLTRGEQSSCVY